MNKHEIEYCLSKQLPRAYSIQTDYGEIQLDEELSEAINKSLKPILERRLLDRKK